MRHGRPRQGSTYLRTANDASVSTRRLSIENATRKAHRSVCTSLHRLLRLLRQQPVRHLNLLRRRHNDRRIPLIPRDHPAHPHLLPDAIPLLRLPPEALPCFPADQRLETSGLSMPCDLLVVLPASVLSLLLVIVLPKSPTRFLRKYSQSTVSFLGLIAY